MGLLLWWRQIYRHTLKLDEAELLEDKYAFFDTTFVIDDSGSMAG